MTDALLFPPYLNAMTTDGNPSRGPAVLMLNILLMTLVGAGYLEQGNDELTLTDWYTDATRFYMSALQEKLGIDVDGNFGPETRSALSHILGWHVGDVQMNVCAQPGFYAHSDGTLRQHPTPRR